MCAQLPEVKVTTAGWSTFRCAVCGGATPDLDIPIPSAYTAASVDAGDVPEPVCEDCIRDRYPVAVWEEILRERRRFERS